MPCPPRLSFSPCSTLLWPISARIMSRLVLRKWLDWLSSRAMQLATAGIRIAPRHAQAHRHSTTAALRQVGGLLIDSVDSLDQVSGVQVYQAFLMYIYTDFVSFHPLHLEPTHPCLFHSLHLEPNHKQAHIPSSPILLLPFSSPSHLLLLSSQPPGKPWTNSTEKVCKVSGLQVQLSI